MLRYALVCLVYCATANAQDLLLDFGATPVTKEFANNAPYSSGAWDVKNWNTVIRTTSKLTFTDRSTGPTISFGALTNGRESTIVDFSSSTPPIFSNPGTSAEGGPFASLNSPGTNFVFVDMPTGGKFAALGITIGGLAEGRYKIYIVGINTNLVNKQNSPRAQPQAFWVTTSATAPNTIDLSTLGSSTVALNSVSSERKWMEGDNYIVAQANIPAQGYLTIIATGAPAYGGSVVDPRAFLNLIEVIKQN